MRLPTPTPQKTQSFDNELKNIEPERYLTQSNKSI